jgi:hypothetical protein
MRAIYAGLAVFIAGGILGAVIGPPVAAAVALPGFTVVLIAQMYGHFFGLRCPWCGGNMAPLMMQRVSFSLDRRLGFCPYCGVGLGEELPDEADETI